MSAGATRTDFVLPAELSATEPPEARQLGRDGIRLLVADDPRVRHARFRDLGRFLRPGDLLVVNRSATVAAAIDGSRHVGGAPVVVHFSTPLDDGDWLVELRTVAAAPVRDAAAGERVGLPAGATLTLLAGHPDDARTVGSRLWRARVAVEGGVTPFLAREGRPIRYDYVPRRWPLAAYQTVFAAEPGSAEMPSAGRPFTTDLVTDLVSAGVVVAPVVLHSGVSSLEGGEPPLAERYDVPAATAGLVEWAPRSGGRVVAVGTTVARALESAADPDGSMRPSGGWTELVLGPDRPARVVDGLITGWHAPGASHLSLLEAVAGSEVVRRAYAAALEHGYLWHEFGDSCLLWRTREG